MAKTERMLQGRCGNLIFYRVKGITRIRSVPLDTRDANTPAQQSNRKRLIAALRFYQRLKETPLRFVWKVAAEDATMSGYNLFMKLNIHVFNDCSLYAPAGLMMTIGHLPGLNNLRVTGQSGSKVMLNWTNSASTERAHSGDRLQVVALFERRMYSPVWLKNVDACRSDQYATVDVGETGDYKVHLYCFFSSPCGRAFSSSGYVYITSGENI